MARIRAPNVREGNSPPSTRPLPFGLSQIINNDLYNHNNNHINKSKNNKNNKHHKNNKNNNKKNNKNNKNNNENNNNNHNHNINYYYYYYYHHYHYKVSSHIGLGEEKIHHLQRQTAQIP